MSERQRRNLQRELARRNEENAGLEDAQRRIREGAAAEEERRRQEVNADPRTVAFVRSMEERQRHERDAAKLRRYEEEQQRQAKGRGEIEDFGRQRLNLWLLNGGDQEGFRAAWPAMEREFMAGKQADRQRLIQEGGVF